jgi:SAM-dependent methyltransferase
MNTTDPQTNPPDPQQRFTQMYLEGITPWDTGISPPELLAAIQGDAALPPGRALDLGCGTGTNSIALAAAGWQVVGVDFAAPAIAQAQAKAAQAQAMLAHAHGSVTFIQGDVTRLAPPITGEQKNLLLDLGCLNGIPTDRRSAYAQVLAQQAAPDALLLLYAHLPHPDGTGPLGCTPEDLDALLSATFVLERREMGQAPQGGASMWNWFRRRY